PAAGRRREPGGAGPGHGGPLRRADRGPRGERLAPGPGGLPRPRRRPRRRGEGPGRAHRGHAHAPRPGGREARGGGAREPVRDRRALRLSGRARAGPLLVSLGLRPTIPESPNRRIPGVGSVVPVVRWFGGGGKGGGAPSESEKEPDTKPSASMDLCRRSIFGRLTSCS